MRQSVNSANEGINPCSVFVVHLLDRSRFSKRICFIDDEDHSSSKLLCCRVASTCKLLHLLECLGDELSHFADRTTSSRHETEAENRYFDRLAPRDRVTETVRESCLTCP